MNISYFIYNFNNFNIIQRCSYERKYHCQNNKKLSQNNIICQTKNIPFSNSAKAKDVKSKKRSHRTVTPKSLKYQEMQLPPFFYLFEEFADQSLDGPRTNKCYISVFITLSEFCLNHSKQNLILIDSGATMDHTLINLFQQSNKL